MIDVYEFQPLNASSEEWDLFHTYGRKILAHERPNQLIEPNEIFEKSLKSPNPNYNIREYTLFKGGELINQFSRFRYIDIK